MAHKVHAAIVLDRSGSMEDCRSDAVGAVNSYVRQIGGDAELDACVSLITFDSQSIDTIRDRVPASTFPALRADEYQPRASTPLLDAVGISVGMLDSKSDEGERRILAIMTDGLENASREFTRERLKALLDRKQQEDGWLILYLGANHDSWSQARDLGVMAGNTANFDKSSLNETADAVFARARRYAMSPVARSEAAEGGFTPDERASMSRPAR